MQTAVPSVPGYAEREPAELHRRIPTEHAEPLVQAFVKALRAEGLHVETGVFAARMEVELVNDGPVTIVLEA